MSIIYYSLLPSALCYQWHNHQYELNTIKNSYYFSDMSCVHLHMNHNEDAIVTNVLIQTLAQISPGNRMLIARVISGHVCSNANLNQYNLLDTNKCLHCAKPESILHVLLLHHVLYSINPSPIYY